MQRIILHHVHTAVLWEKVSFDSWVEVSIVLTFRAREHKAEPNRLKWTFNFVVCGCFFIGINFVSRKGERVPLLGGSVKLVCTSECPL